MTRGIKPQVTFSPVGVHLRATHLRAITRNVRLATVWASEPSRREIDSCRRSDGGTVGTGPLARGPSPSAVPRSAPRVGPALFMEPLPGSGWPWRFSWSLSQSAVVSPLNLAEPRRWLFSSTNLTNRYFLTRSIRVHFNPKRNRNREPNVTQA